MKNEISLKYKSALVLPFDGTSNNIDMAASINATMMQYGFIATDQLFNRMTLQSEDTLTSLYNSVIPILKKMVGADVDYTPMYPNFPKQVMEASDTELFINAIIHYWTAGQWSPDYEKLPRNISFEHTKFKNIDSLEEDEFGNIFTQLLSSNESISATDKENILWFIENVDDLKYPDEIPFKENMACVASILLVQGHDIQPLIKTTTDVLRVATGMSGGDVSLAENTKFRSQPRKIRRALVAQLERVINEEDVNRHRNKWNKLFHNLHIGELSESVNVVAKKIRNNEKIETFNGKVQHAIDTKDITAAIKLLEQRPGEYARKIDHLLRLTVKKRSAVIAGFLSVANKVSTRVLLQLLGNLKIRHENVESRTVFPKGNVQHAHIIRTEIPALTNHNVNLLKAGIEGVLHVRFSELEDMGNVYIDPRLIDCPLPTQQRSASEGLFQVARGTKLPLGDKNTLRFFIYWIGRDIDLSASLHDEHFSKISGVSYTQLDNSEYQSYHSGDKTNAPAPKGACEFIDITMDGALKAGARYIVMNVLVYSGPTFAEHEKCYAGWMTRANVDDNEIFDAKTVEQKVDVTAESKNTIPVVFDLLERKAIWTDLNTRRNTNFGGNNLESNKATISETLEAIVNMNNKVSLYELFSIHANAHGTIVDTKEEADVVFSIDEGITPFNLLEINSDYLV